ncbi:MAG: hypothetical protein LV480_14260 [Methylacidiphilales bacterium]|nr:hypothetical protein [Candidatus Methylacidiphilales bacterium]
MSAAVSGFAAPDEIDKAIAEGVPKNSEVWLNGLFVPIDLPSDASASQIAAQVAHWDGTNNQNDSDQFRDYRIIEAKQVVINGAPGKYTAILITSARGSKTLILAQYTDFNNAKVNQANGLKITLVQNQPSTRTPKPKPFWWHRSFYLTTVP